MATVYQQQPQQPGAAVDVATSYHHQLAEIASAQPVVPFHPSSSLPLVPPPPQGTVYFAPPPYFFANGMPLPFLLTPGSVPPENGMMDMPPPPPNDCYAGPLQEETQEVPSGTVYYSQPPGSFPVPFPPPMQQQSGAVFNPYVRPGPMYFIPQPFVCPPPSNNPIPPPTLPLPPASLQIACPKSGLTPISGLPAPLSSAPKQYQSWSTTSGGTVQNNGGTLKVSPRKDGTFVTADSSTAFSQASLTSSYASAAETGSNQTSFKFLGNNGYKNGQRDGFDRGEQLHRNKSGPSLNNYRTKLCINYKNGYCPYGDRCRFIHQPSDGPSKTTFSTNAPAFVPGAKAVRAEQSSPSASVEMGASNRLYSSTPVSLLGKSQARGVDFKETPTNRRVSYRHDFNAGYRRPSVADGPHLLPAY